MMPRCRWSIRVLGFVPILLGSALEILPVAAEVKKDECIQANVRAQSLRRDGKLQGAREQLRICVNASCPVMVRDDCSRRLDDLERVQPTIVFDVKDAAGHDLSDVSLKLDGSVVAKRLDGAALPVDPGEHSFVFEAEGQPAVTQRFVLKEGEKARRERIVIAAAPASPVAPETPALVAPPAESMPPPVPPPHGLGTQQVVGIAAGAAGAASLIMGSVFGLVASSQWNDSLEACRSAASCPDHSRAVSQHDAATTSAGISTVAFIAGGLLLGGGALLFFTEPKPSNVPVTGLVISPAVAPNTAALALGGRF